MRPRQRGLPFFAGARHRMPHRHHRSSRLPNKERRSSPGPVASERLYPWLSRETNGVRKHAQTAGKLRAARAGNMCCLALQAVPAMSQHRDRRYISATAEQVFDLIADVERYPEFLPIWRSAQIYERESDVYFTMQEVGLGPIRERFRTRTELVRPQRIQVSSPDPLFHAFGICWTLAPFRGGCKVGIELTWQMRSRALQRAIDLFLPTVASTMVDAFDKRAREVLA